MQLELWLSQIFVMSSTGFVIFFMVGTIIPSFFQVRLQNLKLEPMELLDLRTDFRFRFFVELWENASNFILISMGHLLAGILCYLSYFWPNAFDLAFVVSLTTTSMAFICISCILYNARFIKVSEIKKLLEAFSWLGKRVDG